MVFDGRQFAGKIARELEGKFQRMGRKVTLAAMLDPQNEAAVKYTSLKKKMAERLGVDFREISTVNEGRDADGIIVQLPYPNSDALIAQIDPQKDVDGLRDDSPFKPAVVRAVMAILADAKKWTMDNGQWTVTVVGSKGFVGQRLLESLSTVNFPLSITGMDKDDFDPERSRRADVIISCTGQPGLIKAEMIKNGFVAIDVGYPQPEFTPEALAKASFYTPVPGGVGPVTVVMLFASLLESCK